MNNLIKIVLLTFLTTLFYWYVGQQVPQKETHPPETTEIRASMNIDEMVAAGQEVFSGRELALCAIRSVLLETALPISQGSEGGPRLPGRVTAISTTSRNPSTSRLCTWWTDTIRS